MGKSLKITALSPEELANVLSQAGRKAISAADVRIIAETAGILAPDETINLIDYTAFLAQEVAGGAD
ncbi:MAG: hypothetical protein OEV87_00695 [Phycisphaerae bacterium]|nr:hypothetical protein [Phycisphaerae bacterium]